MICQSCGTANAQDAPICRRCGLPFVGAGGSPFSQLAAEILQAPPEPSPQTSPIPLARPDQTRRSRGTDKDSRRQGCIGTLILFGLIGLLALAWMGWVVFWDNISGASPIVTCSTGMTSLSGLAWSPDGSRIAAASNEPGDGPEIWNAGNCRPLLVYQGQDQITALAWSPDGRDIASAGVERNGDFGDVVNTVRIWNVQNGNSVLRLAVKAVNALAWSPNGRYLVAAGADAQGRAQVQVWDVSSGKVMWDWLGEKGAAIDAVGWSPDGHRIAAGGGTSSDAQNSPIAVFDALTGVRTFTFNGQQGQITHLAWSPDGKWIASTNQYFTAGYDSDDDPIQIDSSMVQIWAPVPGGRVHSYDVDANDVAWSPDSQRIVLVNENVRVMDALSGNHVYSYHQGPETDNAEPVQMVAWSPDGARIATASDEFGNIEIWHPQGATEFIGHAYVFDLLKVGVATLAISLAIFLFVLFAFRDRQETVRSRLGCSLGCGGCLLLSGALVIAGMALFGLFVS